MWQLMEFVFTIEAANCLFLPVCLCVIASLRKDPCAVSTAAVMNEGQGAFYRSTFQKAGFELLAQ